MNPSATLLLLSLALFSVAAIGQDAETGTAADAATELDDEPEVLEQEMEEPRLIPVSPEAAPVPDSDAPSESSENEAAPDGEAAPGAGPESGRDVRASMERFVPSEKISEDRSVAFPNDI